MNANIFCNKCHRIPSQCGCSRALNGYELADELQETEPYYSTDYKLFDKAAAMLRQQADRIAELEKLVHQRFDDGKRLGVIETEDRLKQQSVEPFIWLKQDFDGEWIEVHPNKGIPLYTTPQIKELSDEEINLVIWESYQSIGNATLTDLCKAILKKASEQ